MYTGKIIYQGSQITVAAAIALNLITQDVSGDVWLKQDTNKAIRIKGDLVIK